MNQNKFNPNKNSSSSRLQSFALALYFFSIHFESWDPFLTGIDYLITKFTIMFYISVSLVNFKYFRVLKKYKKFIIPIIIIFIVQTISAYLYQRPGYTEYFSIILFLHIFTFILILLHNIRDKYAITKALNAFILGGLLLGFFFLIGFETDTSFHGRTTIFGVNQNMLGINLSIILILIIHRLIFEKNIDELLKIGFVIFIPILIYFLASTGSRSGFFSLLAGLIILFFFKKNRDLLMKSVYLFFGFILGTSIIFYFLNNKTIGNRIIASAYDGDLSGREKYWETIPKLVDINPFFGIGKTGYSYETELLYGTYTSAHNIFIESLVMGGYVSLFYLFIFLFRLIKQAIINYKRTYNVLNLSLLMPIIIMSLVGHTFGTKISWGIFAYIITEINRNQFKLKSQL
jgi:O-antigen ligase